MEVGIDTNKSCYLYNNNKLEMFKFQLIMSISGDYIKLPELGE